MYSDYPPAGVTLSVSPSEQDKSGVRRNEELKRSNLSYKQALSARAYDGPTIDMPLVSNDVLAPRNERNAKEEWLVDPRILVRPSMSISPVPTSGWEQVAIEKVDSGVSNRLDRSVKQLHDVSERVIDKSIEKGIDPRPGVLPDMVSDIRVDDQPMHHDKRVHTVRNKSIIAALNQMTDAAVDDIHQRTLIGLEWCSPIADTLEVGLPNRIQSKL
jgi:hypothetical protein